MALVVLEKRGQQNAFPALMDSKEGENEINKQKIGTTLVGF